MNAGINTIIQAYDLLEIAGTIGVRPQSGYYVRSRGVVSSAQTAGKKPDPELTANPVIVGEVRGRILRTIADARLIPLGRSVPNGDLLPVQKLNRVLAATGRRHASIGAALAPSNGVDQLRIQLAKRSLDYGCSLSPEQIIITSGCVEAVTLAIQATCRAGDTIAVESPFLCNFLNFIQWMGLKVLEIPSSPQDGMNLDVLAYALKQTSVRACLIISNFSNPLGCLMPEEKKRQLVRLLAKHGIPLIEDDVYGDLCFGHARPPAFKAYDENGLVLHCSSFSKTLAPGYRVGWIAPGRFQERVEALKSLVNMATATPTQLAIADYLEGVGYDRHLRAMRRKLCQRMAQVQAGVARHFPAGTRFNPPQGGYFLWVEMPETVDALKLHQAALRNGIALAPGMLFTTGNGFGNCLRLNVSFWSPKVEQALQTVGRLARTMADSGR
jgi:DNA-binding transcriptional MocR family regulator